MTEKIIKIAAQLYEARDAMRQILGDRYVEKCTFWVERINVTMQRRGCNEITAAMELAKDLQRNGAGTGALFATVVEMVEGIFALPAIGSTIKYRQTHPSRPGVVAEGKAEVCQYITAATAPAPHMRPPERMLFVRGCDHGRMHGQHFLVKQSEVVAS